MKLDPDVEAALASVADMPLDEGRKRVFTDLLLERGDPRGEFMLLQFVMASNQASGAVRQRAMDLWQSHKREWMKELANVLDEVELQNGFPISGTLRSSPEGALNSAMFVTLRKLRAKTEGRQLLIAAAADPRLTGLEQLELDDDHTFRAIAQKGVPDRLTRLALKFFLSDLDLSLILEAPALRALKRFSFRYVMPPAAPRGLGRRVREAFVPPAPFVSLIERLSTHPRLEVIDLGHAQGDVPLFMQIAALWPKLRFRQICCPGTFELSREEDGTVLLLQNLSAVQLIEVRRSVPKDVTRARLMRTRRTWEQTSPDELVAAWAPIQVTLL